MRYLSSYVLLVSLPGLLWSQTLLTHGQIQFLQINFNTVPEPAWDIRIENETLAVEYSSTFVTSGLRTFDAVGGARFRVQGNQHLFTRPATPDWNFTGVAPGQLFRATPQNGDPDTQLIMGISSLGVSSSFFDLNQFTITLSTVGLGNPGDFALYGNDNTFGSAIGSLSPFPILLSTSDNISSFIYTGGTQNFFNLSFSEPGIYELDFQFSGVRTIAGEPVTYTSPFYRYRFEVAAIPEPTTWALLGCSAAGGMITCWQLRRLHRKKLQAEVELPV